MIPDDQKPSPPHWLSAVSECVENAGEYAFVPKAYAAHGIYDGEGFLWLWDVEQSKSHRALGAQMGVKMVWQEGVFLFEAFGDIKENGAWQNIYTARITSDAFAQARRKNITVAGVFIKEQLSVRIGKLLLRAAEAVFSKAASGIAG